ncbi:helix-turn-helix transcriptional regulator [Psychrobium sp. nBUS_13]|uniref:helix-turn-helix transcriptional regulator n=1 Tax=Psychrobium sp. nBUS_13 TaxID=3395319 RepID=UPI003EC0697D
MEMNTNETPVNQNLINPLGVERRMRTKEVLEIVGLSRTTIHRLTKKFRFPLSKNMTANIVSWSQSDLREWLEIGADGWYEKHGKAQEQKKLAQQAA